MNEVIKNILTRRSVRKFIADKQINDEDLNLIIEAAKSAPSNMNAQSWHFTVIQNKQKIDKLNSLIINSTSYSSDDEMNLARSRQKVNYFYNAPTVILVSNNSDSSYASAPVADSSAALQNIFLAAHSLGLGSCWIQILSFLDESESLRDYLRELGVPKNYRIYGTAIIGYPDGEVQTDIIKKDGTVNIVK